MDWKNLQPDVYKLLNTHYTEGREGRSIDKILVHYNAGNLTVEGCWSVWQTRPASAHYQVEEHGRIGQLVNDWDTAWHASNWYANTTSIGIEHANYKDGTISATCLDQGAHLVAALCVYYKLGRPEWLKNVFPHKYFAATSCPGQIYGSQKTVYIQRAQEWYDAMVNGASEPSTLPDVPVNPEAPAYTGLVPVHYGLRVCGGDWWPEVTNFGGGDDGYAGAPYTRHDLLYMYADEGELKYRTHYVGGNWLPWVYKADKNDTVNGCAGLPGRAIDGVQCYYTTPEGKEYKQAWYRSQTTERSGYLPVCCDDGTTYRNYDGWAGMLREPLDRFQLAIADGNPF